MHWNGLRGWAAGLLALVCITPGTSLSANNNSIPIGTSVLTPFVERGEIAGAVVMIVDANHVLEYEAVGYSDIATRRAMTTDALFWIASTSKPFVATAVMMLVEEHRLSLDDPVSKFLPDFQPRVALMRIPPKVTTDSTLS